MNTTHPIRLASAALAGLALVVAGLAGPASAARAGTWLASAVQPGGIISTIAGGPGGPGPATSYTLDPCGVRYADGSVYIGDNVWQSAPFGFGYISFPLYGFVRAVSVATGALTTVAGNAATGPPVSGGPATGTNPGGVCGTSVDAAGNLVVAAGGVLVVAAKTGTFYGQQMTAGHIYHVMPSVGEAVDVAADPAGNLVVADQGDAFCSAGCCCWYSGAQVQVLAARTGTFYGQQMTAGDTYTVAGTNAFTEGPLPDGDGGPAPQAFLGTELGAVQVDAAGNIVLAEGGPGCGPCAYPQTIYTQNSVQVIAGATGTFYGQQMTAGDIYNVAGVPSSGSDGNGGGGGINGNGGPATQTVLQNPGGVAIDSAGNLVIADYSQVRVVAVSSGTFYGQQMTGGDIYGLAGVPGSAGFSGDGGPATQAELTASTDTIDGHGNVLIADGISRVRVVAVGTGTFYGQHMTGGDIYTVAGNGTAQWLSGLGGPAPSAQIGSPGAISADPAGDVAASAYGTALVVPARTGTFYGRHMTGGYLYMLTKAGCTASNCVAFDGNGNVLLGGSPVRLIPVRSGRFFGRTMVAGHSYAISTSAGAVGADHHGNALLVSGNQIKVVAASTGTFYGQRMKAGRTYIVAGDGRASFNGDGRLATSAGMSPKAVAVDAAGNIIVTVATSRVRVVAVSTGTMYGRRMTAGRIYTIAGHGAGGFSGNRGPAAAARFGFPDGVTIGRSGTVLFADTRDDVVWAVAVSTGTFYGQHMTAGHVYVVAGRGTRVPGDGGPATGAALGGPTSVTASPSGALLLTDNSYNRLQAVSP
jgi:hypothetical protein